MLRDILEKRELKQKDFARRVNVSQSLISNAVRGRHVPRVIRGTQWATALDLNEAETRVFIEALELANSPPGVQRLVRKLRAQIRKLERS